MNSKHWKVGAGRPQVVFARQPFPTEVTKTVFLAGPTPRGDGPSWRPAAVDHLGELGFDGHVFVPEPKDGTWADEYEKQIGWEEEALHRADCIVFWIPRDITGEKFYGVPMPAFTTNDEWGFWKDSGKVVLGAPGMAEKVRYQQHYADKFGAPFNPNLKGVMQTVVSRLGEGALRRDGATQVPLHVWQKAEFQGWLRAQEAAGNRLDGCRVDWSFRVPPPNFQSGSERPSRLYLYALHVNMHIGSENRQKKNEVVVFRPDLSTVVLYRPGAHRGDTEVAIVREFRSPGRNGTGFVFELPGGSASGGPLEAATKEVEEETGLKLDHERFQSHGARQIGATLSAHICHLFSVLLTDDEMDKLKADKSVHGENAEEQTYVEVWRVNDLLKKPVVDWSMVGMALSVLAG